MQMAANGFRAHASDVVNIGPHPGATPLVTKIASWLRARWASKSIYATRLGAEGLRDDMLSDAGLWPDHAAVYRHHDPVLLALQVGSGSAL